jgi:tetratricopeptide (TPR) repeat protein
MFIYFLVGSKRNRTKAFNEYIESEMNRNGIYATICSNIDEVNSSVIIRLLKYEHEWLCAIGEKYKRNSVSLQDKTKIDVTWKDGIDLYGLYSWHNDKREEIQPLIHSAIGNIMKSIKREIDSKSNKYRAGAMENSHIIRVYNDVSLWAEKTKYEIEKHCELLSNYKDFLNKIRQYNSAEDIHLKFVKLIEEKNGLDSLVTADEYKKIGLIFFQHKKYENAIKYLKDAMKIYESNTEKDNREMQVIQILISEARKHIEGLGGKKKSYIATIDS